MGFEDIPIKNTINDENKVENTKEPMLSRRDVLRGIFMGGSAIGISNVLEKKKPGFLRAFDSISNAFENFSKRINGETEKSEMEIKNIADHYVKAHETLSQNPDFFPRSLFCDNLLIAQEIQESGCDIDARSPMGAKGLRQTMDIALKDNTLLLELLNDDGVIEHNGPIYVGVIEERIKELMVKKIQLEGKNNPANHEIISNLGREIKQRYKELEDKKRKYGDRILNDVDLVKLEKFIMHDQKYASSMGELFLMRLYNNKYGLGAGYDKFNKERDIKGAQTEILGAYNAGLAHVKNKPIEEWADDEPRTYVKNIFNLMDRAENVRNALEQNGQDRSNNDVVKFITLELNKVTTSGDKRPEVLEKAMNYLVALVINEEKKLGRPLMRVDIENLRDDLSKTPEISTDKFYS